MRSTKPLLIIIPLVALPFVSRVYLNAERVLTDKATSVYYSTIDRLGFQPKQMDGSLYQMIDKAAERYNISKALLRSLAVTESNIDPEATSKAGARGVLQVMPSSAEACELEPQELYNAKLNIDCGARIFARNLEKTGNPADALCMYNSGKVCSKYSPQETKDYLVKILKNLPM